MLCQYFTILKLKKYRAAHIYIYIYICVCVYVYIYKIKGKVKVSNPTGHLRRQKNKKKPKQKCQNWAFKMTKKKKSQYKSVKRWVCGFASVIEQTKMFGHLKRLKKKSVWLWLWLWCIFTCAITTFDGWYCITSQALELLRYIGFSLWVRLYRLFFFLRINCINLLAWTYLTDISISNRCKFA